MTLTLRTLRILILCGSALLQPGLAHADVVLDWNIVTLKATAAAAFNPPLESRNVAIVHAAMFDAVNSILRKFQPYAVGLHAPEGASPEAAVAAAAHFALVQLYPDQRQMVDAAYADSLGQTPDGPRKTDGISVGEKVLEHVFGKHPRVVIQLASPSAPGVVETFNDFRTIADSVVDARVWGGVHWRTSSERGRAVGNEIGRYAAHHFLKPIRAR
jgi:hypothetical protein